VRDLLRENFVNRLKATNRSFKLQDLLPDMSPESLMEFGSSIAHKHHINSHFAATDSKGFTLGPDGFPPYRIVSYSL